MLVVVSYKEGGFSVPTLLLTLAILSVVMTSVFDRLRDMSKAQSESATVSGLTAIGQAAVNWYTDRALGGDTPAWPNDISALVREDYLPVFRNVNGHGFPYALSVSSGQLIVSTQMDSMGAARRVATAFGANADTNPTAPNVARVAFGIPTALGVFDMKYLRLDGDKEMTGNLDLNQNDLVNADLITATRVEAAAVSAKLSDSTGLVEADIVVGNTIFARSFEYIP